MDLTKRMIPLFFGQYTYIRMESEYNKPQFHLKQTGV